MENKDYYVVLGVPHSSPAEPLITDAPLSIPNSFDQVRPSRDSMVDRFLRNFTAHDGPKGERPEALTLEIVLPPDEAARGGRLRLRVPSVDVCPLCRGFGRGSAWCPRCFGAGTVDAERGVEVCLPPNLADREVLDFGMSNSGVRNLFLRIFVRIRGAS
jgi:DnaJ-class molecular chaperone